MLRATDSALKIKCVELAKRQRFIKIKYTPAEQLNYRACSGFGVLGAKAQSAVPALIEIANRNLSRASRWYAIQALVLVSPPAPEAIPLLSGWAINADGSVRSYAINALDRIRAEPGRGLPVLINALNDPDLQIRTAALMALHELGPNAKPALPVLVEFLSNASSDIEWTCASNALMAIDPEAAAKEGITVNAIAPALIETEMITSNPKARPDLVPLGRFGKVEEVADVVVMLASNGYITGQTISVNGGWYMT